MTFTKNNNDISKNLDVLNAIIIHVHGGAFAAMSSYSH